MTLYGLLRYFLKLGAVGFGGPVPLVGYMKRDLVDERRWFTEDDFRQGLALSKLSPGPLATQLAMYFGYVAGGVRGATGVAIAFLLPSFLIVLALAKVYTAYGGLAWMRALFYGVGAALVGVIARSAYRLTTTALGGRRLLWALYATMALSTIVTRSEHIILFVMCGLVSLMAYASPGFSARPREAALPWLILLYFGKAGFVVFGSGLAIIPYLYGGVVEQYAWLTPEQFRDAVAVAMITPGPALITVAFIGYLVAGLSGALLASLGVFLPVYLIVVLFASWFRRHAEHPRLKAFVDGVTAAALGALAGGVALLARTSLTDPSTVFICALTVLVSAKSKLPDPLLLALAGAAGLIIY